MTTPSAVPPRPSTATRNSSTATEPTNSRMLLSAAKRRQSDGAAASMRAPSAGCASGRRIEGRPPLRSQARSRGKNTRPVMPVIPISTPSQVHVQPSSEVASRTIDTATSSSATPMISSAYMRARRA